MDKRSLLLISSSQVYQKGYLDHCIDEIKSLLQEKVQEILFIPYAKKDRDSYAQKFASRLEKEGFIVKSIHSSKNPIKSVMEAKAIFVGGGNTFLLLDELYKNNIIDVIREKIDDGMFYLGSSAGSNIAGKTIKTTNDMPIIYPPSFDALNVVPFQINPHYVDPLPRELQAGETREERIREFHEWSDAPVVALRQEAMLLIQNEKILLKGGQGVKIFQKEKPPQEFFPGEKLDFLLNECG